MVRFHPTVEISPGTTVTGNPSGYSWIDLTMQGYVYQPSGIVIRRGRADRYSEASPDTCTLTLLNNAGTFVPRNPLSPYYGLLATGTPLRVMVRPNINSASDAFGRTASSSWGSADSGGAWTNTGGAASDYSVASASGARHLHTAASSAHYSTLAFSMIRSDVSLRVRVNALSTGAAQTIAVVGNYADASNSRRAELQFGTSGSIVARCVRRIAGVDSMLTSVTTTFTHVAATWYRLRVQIGLTSCRIKVWLDGTTEPATWTADGSNATFLSSGTAGAVGVYSMREAGNTNASATMDFDDYAMADGPRVQFTGFVDQWPVTWADASLSQPFAPITASGQLRRLGRTQPLSSLLYMLLSASPTLVAYWPMQEGTSATTFASTTTAGHPGVFSNVSLAADSSVAGSEPLPTLGTLGQIGFQVRSYTSSGTWAVAWLMKIPQSALSAAAQTMSWICPGSSIVRWQLTLTPGSPDTLRLDGHLAAGGTVSGAAVNATDSSGVELANGRQLYIQVNGSQNGGNVDTNWSVQFLPSDGAAVTSIGQADTFAGTTGRVSYIYHDSVSGFANGGHTIGHVGLGDGDVAFGVGVRGATGGAGDDTQARFDDLLETQGVVSWFGDLVRGQGTTTQLVGPQQTGDILSQLRLIEQTELGVMHDGKQGFVHLLPRDMRYNRPVDLVLDVAAGQVGWPFAPTDDDYLLRNSVTVSNVGGSSAVSTDSASIALQGVRADSVQVSTYLDADLQGHADWRKNAGITAGLRYPSIVLDLTRNHLALADDWCDTDIGSRIQVTNVPSGELPPEDLDLLIDGYAETISSTEWRVELNCSPGGQWLVGELDDTTPRLDCGASITAEALDSTETGVDVAVSDACLWAHDDGDYGVVIGGEQMTVTAVANAIRDTFTRSASSGWGTADSGQSWVVGAGTASLFSATGTVGQIAVSALNTEHHIAVNLGYAPVQRVRVYQTLGVTPTGAPINWGIVLRRADASNLYWIDVQVNTDSTLTLRAISKIAGANTLLASATSATTHSTSVARILVAEIDAVNIIRAKVYSSTAAEPGWELAYNAAAVVGLSSGTSVGCIARLATGNTNATPVNFAFDNFAVLNPQTLTVTRSANGIVKSHSAGAEVHVANPIILGL